MDSILIVLDTNILVANPNLDSADWASLLSHASEWQLKIVIPEIVLMETINVAHRKRNIEIDRFSSHKDWSCGLGKSKEFDSILDAARLLGQEYEATLKSRIQQIGAQVAPLPRDIDHMDIARRASIGIAPYPRKEGAKDGYRDTLVWLTLQDIARKHLNSEVWLVSENHSDFGQGKVTNEAKGSSDGQMAWHNHLANELKQEGLEDRVFFECSLGRLERHLSLKFAPLSGDELETRWAQVDKKQLDEAFVQKLYEQEISPRSAALKLDTASAVVIASTRESDAVRLISAANHTGEKWSGQFICEANFTLEVTSRLGDVSEVSKPLKVSGQINFGANSEIISIEIDSIDALPNDPQRRAWNRLSGMSAVTQRLGNSIAQGLVSADLGLSPEVMRSLSPRFQLQDELMQRLSRSARLPDEVIQQISQNTQFPQLIFRDPHFGMPATDDSSHNSSEDSEEDSTDDDE